MSKNVSHISGRKGMDENLFSTLVKEGGYTGTAETARLKDLAKEYLVGESTLLGAASFYDFLRKENEGKKAHVCNGSSCMLAGTQDKVKDELAKHYKEEEIGHVCCLGRCHENSSFQVEGVNFSGDAVNNISAILDGAKGDDTYNVGANVENPHLTGEFPGIETFYSLLPELLKRDRDELLKEIIESNVRGRGGAGFPAGIKWQTVKNAPKNPKFVVCNADEGDPGAYSDRYLLEKQPHLVIFGMMVCGYITGAETGIFYIRAEYPESVDIITKAVDELMETEYLGDNICGTDFNFHFKVVKGAGSYVCGEETALLSSLEGQRPEVRIRPPFPAVEGLFRKPTALNNVETFAVVHPVFSIGGAEYAKIGRGRSSGTKLVSLDSFFNKPGIYEIEMGTPLTTIFEDFGGGFKTDIKAVHIGGPLGGVVPKEKFADITLDFESFNENGFLLGHASVISIPVDYPLIQYIEHLFKFTADESCGKCFPCRLGSTRGEELIHKARTSDYKIDPQLITDLLDTLEQTSLCALGGGVPLPVKNILQYFETELKPFFKESEK